GGEQHRQHEQRPAAPGNLVEGFELGVRRNNAIVDDYVLVTAGLLFLALREKALGQRAERPERAPPHRLEDIGVFGHWDLPVHRPRPSDAAKRVPDWRR